MSDNTLLNSGTGGDNVRDLDRLSSGVKTQVVQIDFGGSSANAEQLASATNPLPIAISATPFVPSAGNTSSTQLAAGATFVGTIQANQNQPMISIDAFSDQPMLLWVQQYIDAAGTQKIPSIYPNGNNTPIPANTGLGFAFPGNGNYYQVFAQNMGTSTTTKFVCDSGSGTLGAVTNLGNAPMALNEIAGIAVNATVGIPIQITGTPTLNIAQLIAAQSNDAPISSFISGDPNGDLAGINILEQLVDESSGLAITMRPRAANDFHKVDANNAIVQSDAIPVVIRGLVGTVYDVDTMGYQSLGFSADSTSQASVSVSNTKTNFVTASIVSTVPASVWNNVILASGTYVHPVQSRYVRLTFTAAGFITVYLRSTPCPVLWAINYVTPTPVSTSDGVTIGTQITAATPVPLVIKASAGRLYHLSVGNPNSAAVYLKLFNATSATLGTTSANMNFLIPNGQTVFIPVGDKGLYLNTGITVAVTNAASLTDATAITTGCELNYSFF